MNDADRLAEIRRDVASYPGLVSSDQLTWLLQQLNAAQAQLDAVFSMQAEDINLSILPRRLLLWSEMANAETTPDDWRAVVSDMVDDMRQVCRALRAAQAEIQACYRRIKELEAYEPCSG